ncbi:MAG: hypothetical protein ACKO9Q_06710, partial [Pirellula sp.]
RVSGNLIGTSLDGSLPLGNQQSGVEISNGAKSNLIGGTTAVQRNVLSGGISGVARGVHITGQGTQFNVVAGNYVGLNAAGTAAIKNENTGVYISGGASNNTVGGSSVGARNILSGNKLAGLAVDTGCTLNLVQNNWIGLNAAGTLAIPNQAAGIGLINGASQTTILDNVISGNSSAGISLQSFGSGTLGSNNNIVRGNKIGT